MKTYILFLLIAIALPACNSRESTESNEGNDFEIVNPEDSTKKEILILESSISMLDVPQQFFEINSKKQQTITGNRGTKITFPKGCFDDESELIKIELREYYGVADMLLGGLSTTSNGACIETDGMIYINATNNKGDTIKLNKSVTIEISTTKQKENIKIFDNTIGEVPIDWKLSKSKIQSFTIDYPILDTILWEKYKAVYEKSYLFETANLGWINCDRFMDFKNTTDLIVSLPEGQQGAVYSLAFYSFNSILPAIPNEEGQLVFKGVPVGEKVSLIGIGGKDEELYFGVLDLTTDTKTSKMSKLEAGTKDEIRSTLETKFGNTLAERPKPIF